MRAPDALIFSLRQAACLGLLMPLLAMAQEAASTRDAANPDAVGALLSYTGMKGPWPDSEMPSPNAWRAAHDVVAAFPRGHADIMAWEQQQSAANPPLAPASAPPAASGRLPHSNQGTQPMQPHQHMPVQRGKP